jgi:hypothetical protein
MNEQPSGRRVTFVALLLAALFGIGTFLFLLLVSGGLIIAVLIALAGMAAAGALHYLVWGRQATRRP